MTDRIELMISEDAILQKIASLAEDLDAKLKGEEIVIVMILKGAICFVADLMRRIKSPVVLETIRCESYGMRGISRGELTVSGLEKLDLCDKNVVVVDDIFDSGFTLATVLDQIKLKNPRRLLSAVLLVKHSEKVVAAKPDYALFEIENEFVIGYGLDFKEHYRGLRGVYKFIQKSGA